MNNKYSEEMLSILREKVKVEMGEKRYNHTLHVEKMAQLLGEIYAPEKVPMLRAAALLHDVTKERSSEEHFAIMESHGCKVSDVDRASPKMLHSKTGALIIPDKYPEYSEPELVNAVRYHTTGKPDMTVAEKIIYLADYIDMSRTFPDCVKLREYFFSVDLSHKTSQEKLAHLRETLILSYDLTMRGLLDDGKLIDEMTIKARNFLILER